MKKVTHPKSKLPKQTVTYWTKEEFVEERIDKTISVIEILMDYLTVFVDDAKCYYTHVHVY